MARFDESIERSKVALRRDTLSPLPAVVLSMATQSNSATSWVTEHLLKRKKGYRVDRPSSRRPCAMSIRQYRSRGIRREGLDSRTCLRFRRLRAARVLAGRLLPVRDGKYDHGDLRRSRLWVREFLGILQGRKLKFVSSMKGARFDIVELGGGDASTTVIFPRIFREFRRPLRCRDHPRRP